MFLGSQGQGRAWKKNGIYVLSLKGTDTEMASQHGALLRQQIQQGALISLAKKNQDLVNYAPALSQSKVLTKLALGALRLLEFPLRRGLPPSYREEAYALAKSAGLDLRTVEQASLQADLLVQLMSHSMRRHMMKRFLPNGRPTMPGCSSVIALAENTKDNGLIHGRNFDYPFVGSWDTYPTVMYMDPTQGQRVISMQTAGVHTAGITAVNESGLTLTVHFHCSTRVSLFHGLPVHVIGAEIMKKARTMGEAIDLMRRMERSGSWSFVLSSGRENKGVVLEVAYGQMAIRDADATRGKLAATNMYRDDKLRDSEVLISCSALDDFTYRYNRANELLDHYASKGTLTPALCARILADNIDQQTGALKAHGNTLSVITTVTSMISQTALGKFYVANRNESPVCLGDYAAFDLDETFKGFDDRDLPQMTWDESAGGPARSCRGTQKEKALQEFRRAYMAYHNEFDWQKCADHLKTAIDLAPDEGHFRIALGHMHMRLQRPQEALHAFLGASKDTILPLSPHMSQTLDLFTAHALDCCGERSQALDRYKRLDDDKTLSPHVRKEAKRGLKYSYDLRRARRITFDLQYCDAFDYG
jgi:hypothetical protein